MPKLKATLVALTIGTMVTTGAASAQDAIRFGTSSVGSLFYTLAIGASEIIHKHAKLNVNVEPVGGSTASLHSLGAKKIELAMANSFASFSAYYGQYKFKKPVDVRLVIKGQPNYRGLVVRKAARIKLASDLKGKIIIGKRRALPENELVMRAMMKAMGAFRRFGSPGRDHQLATDVQGAPRRQRRWRDRPLQPALGRPAQAHV